MNAAAERETQLDPESKVVAQRATARTRDLKDGADTVVPKGDEKFKPQPAHGADPRKALYAKMVELRKGESVAFNEDHPGVSELEAAADREMAESDGNELHRRGSIDTETIERGPGREPLRVVKDDAVRALDKPGGKTTVTVNGKTFDVPTADVNEAGGIESYQKRRAATIELGDAARKNALADDKLREADRLLEEARKRGANAPATDAPAPGGSGSPSIEDAVGSAGDVQKRAEAVVRQLYSGDQAKATAAIAEIIRASGKPAQQLDPDAIAQTVLQKLSERQRAEQQPKPGEAEDPGAAAIRKAEIAEANTMFATRFKEVHNDPELKTLARAHYAKLVADPENANRSPVDLAREAGRYVENKYLNPRSNVVERKRELLTPQPSGSIRAPAEDEGEVMDDKSYIAMLQKRRGQAG